MEVGIQKETVVRNLHRVRLHRMKPRTVRNKVRMILSRIRTTLNQKAIQLLRQEARE